MRLLLTLASAISMAIVSASPGARCTPAVEAQIDTPFFHFAPSGYSAEVPWNTTVFETVSTMHDPTVTDSGTATGTQTSTTLQDTSKTWTVNAFTGYFVRTLAGTGSARWRKISSNTADTLTISPAWTVTPVSGSTTYEITELSTRLVAPISGIYMCHAQLGYEKPLTLGDTYGVRLDVNGVFKAVKFNSNSGVTEHESAITKHFDMAAGDYVEVFAYQNSGLERRMLMSSRSYASLVYEGKS